MNESNEREIRPCQLFSFKGNGTVSIKDRKEATSGNDDLISGKHMR